MPKTSKRAIQAPPTDSLDYGRKRSQWRDVLHRLTRNKLAMLGLGVVLVLVLAAVFADFVAPYDPDVQDYTNMKAYPSFAHPLGTDDVGRDTLSRIIYGGRVSLLVSILSIVFGLVVGGIIGVSAGYFGGVYDGVIMRVMDVFMALPGLFHDPGTHWAGCPRRIDTLSGHRPDITEVVPQAGYGIEHSDVLGDAHITDPVGLASGSADQDVSHILLQPVQVE